MHFPLKKKKIKSQFSYLKIGCIGAEVFLLYVRLDPKMFRYSSTLYYKCLETGFSAEELDHSFTKDNAIILMSQKLIGKAPPCRLSRFLLVNI